MEKFGEFEQPIPTGSEGIYAADMAASGNTGVIGRWVDKWEGSEDFKTWTFRLRPGIKSWAGNEMTSDDIVWTWQRGFEMKAVRYFFASAMFLAKPEDIEVIDKYNFRFRLSKPSPVVLKLMAMSYFGGPFDATLAKQHATASDPWAKEWLKNNDAGFGPYHIVKNIPGQELELVRNENFQPVPPIKRILIRIVPDAATRTALLDRGAVDYAMRLPERSPQALAKNPAVKIVRTKANFIPYVSPVQTNPIMAKTKVRQAMAYATPYDEIHEKVYFGQGNLIKSITPAIFPNYTDKFWVYKYDPKTAKKILAEAGYPDGFDLKLSFDNSIAEMAEAAVLIKAAYDDVGIRTTLDPLPAAVYSERKLRRQLMCQVDNFQWPWIAQSGSASPFRFRQSSMAQWRNDADARQYRRFNAVTPRPRAPAPIASAQRRTLRRWCSGSVVAPRSPRPVRSARRRNRRPLSAKGTGPRATACRSRPRPSRRPRSIPRRRAAARTVPSQRHPRH
jgi:ABC-type transport system substrate-binding protein